jgi:cobalt-zinc-cadmium resistance protein CzcA
LSPVEVEKRVTFVVESALAGIPGLRSTRSLSRNGFAQVTAVFDDGASLTFARQQVSERLLEARESLPAGVEPRMGPMATGLGEITMYTVEYDPPREEAVKRLREAGASGAGLSVEGWQADGSYVTPEGRRLTTELEWSAYLREVQDWIIRPQLRGVKDVAGVEAIGGYVKEYHVRPDPMKLVSYGLSFAEVIEAVERNNVSAGAGFVEHHGESYLVRAAGRIEDAAEIGRIVVAVRDGVPIRVSDVVSSGPGEPAVGIGRELRTGSASENGEEVVVATVIMLVGANSRTVAAAVDAKMSEVNRTLPAGVRAKTVLNRTKLVDATIATVRNNLVEGAALVVAVLLLLLGNVRGAVICALAIPLSMLMTATGMVQGRMSGNLMSLGAIDFGLIVDGAVIIVENCLRRLAGRQHALGRVLTLDERLHEVMAGAKEMVRPSVYGQAIIVTVYVPILALTGVEGKMFHPMALTVILALAGAFVLSLTFVPAMVAILIRGRVREREVAVVRWAKAAYAPVLAWAVRSRWAVAAGSLAALAGAGMVFTRLGQEFVPVLDEKDLAVHAMRISSTGLTQSQAMQFEVERAISAIPEVAYCYSKTGTAEMATDPMPPNVSDTFIIFKPREQWRSEAEMERAIAALEGPARRGGGRGQTEADHDDEHGPGAEGAKARLVRLIRLTLGALPGNQYEFTQPIQMRFNELIAGVRGDVAVKVYGEDLAAMEASARRVLGVLRGVRGVTDAKVEQTEGLPVLHVEIDREAVARYGLSVHDAQEVLAVAVGGRVAGQVFEGDRRFDVVVRLPDAVRERMEMLERLPIPLPRGTGLGEGGGSAGFVPLGSVARVEVTDGASQISRENGRRRIVVQCNVRGRDLGSFVQEAQRAMEGVRLPAGQWLEWGGQYENLVAAKSRLRVVVPACFVLIALLLFSTFRSVRDAMLVFSAVPLGLTGGVLALWGRGLPFSISAAVGLIALSGVAVLNGLVMVSYINQLRREGHDRDEAIARGCLARLRPVLMTAMVASLGFVPMALAKGTGAEVQRPLATVVIGGLVSSTMLTLLVVPALYRLLHGMTWGARMQGVNREAGAG